MFAWFTTIANRVEVSPRLNLSLEGVNRLAMVLNCLFL